MIAGRVLVLGAGGQLGREWDEYLIDNQITYKALTSAQLDITDQNAVTELILAYKPRIVINCAAYTKVDQAESEAQRAFAVNATAPEMLAQLCASADIKLVHYSSDYVYSGEAADRDRYPEGYTENAEINPRNVYGRSKAAGDEAVLKWCSSALIIRVSWLCSAFGHNFVKTMLRLGHENTQIRVVSDQWGSPSYADHVVESTALLLQKGATGIYNVSSDGLLNWHEFADAALSYAFIDADVQAITTAEYPTAASRPFFSKLNCTKTKQLGIVTEDWRSGLRRLIVNMRR